MTLRKTPIRRIGNKDNLWLGCDREPIIGVGAMSATLIFASQEIRATIFGVFLWITALYLLRKAAKSDPKLRFVYQRHRKYSRYYPAKSTPFKINDKNY